MPSTFSNKLERAFDSKGQLCVGIDPHDELLVENGFSLDVEGLKEFSFSMLEQLTDSVSIIKPQVAFFEKYGPGGFLVLQELLSEASRRGFLVIVDAKRGDIGTTMQAYADAWLAKDAPFICDALTVSPYLGVDSLSDAAAVAAERGKALFVLSATSNPEASDLQKAQVATGTVASMVWNQVAELNSVIAQSASKYGNIGVVLGATTNPAEFKIELKTSDKLKTPILAPGFGAQGAKLSEARLIYGDSADQVIFSISRSALREGINNVRQVVTSDLSTLANALIK